MSACSVSCSWMTFASALTTTRPTANAASLSRACCSKPLKPGTSIFPRATSSAIAGATSRRGTARVAAPFSSTTAMENGSRTVLSCAFARSPRRRIGFYAHFKRGYSAMSDRVSSLRVKIFADGADRASILDLARHPNIQGFTTNPTLMRKAGVADYESFAKELVQEIPSRPFSFEVLSDDFEEMEQQALRIASWGSNVYVKIPITNTRAENSAPLISRLVRERVKVNVTAVMTLNQVDSVVPILRYAPPSCISIFAGRVADAGCDPLPILCGALTRIRAYPQIALIWGGPRELFNIVQADAIACHIITVTHDLLKKLPLLGRDLTEYSLDTVKMFFEDARAAGFTLNIPVAQAS